MQIHVIWGSIKIPKWNVTYLGNIFIFTWGFHQSVYQYTLQVLQKIACLLRKMYSKYWNYKDRCWQSSSTAKQLFLVNILDGLDTHTYTYIPTLIHTYAISVWSHTRSWRVWRRIVPSKAWIHFSRSSASRAEGRSTQTHPVNQVFHTNTISSHYIRVTH